MLHGAWPRRLRLKLQNSLEEGQAEIRKVCPLHPFYLDLAF